jgi:hypothetical protein
MASAVCRVHLDGTFKLKIFNLLSYSSGIGHA